MCPIFVCSVFFHLQKRKKNRLVRPQPWIKPFCDLWESLFWENMPNFWQLGTYSFTKKILWFVHILGVHVLNKSNYFVIYGRDYFEKTCPLFVGSALFHLKKILLFVHILKKSDYFVIYGKVYFEKICPIFVSSALFHSQKRNKFSLVRPHPRDQHPWKQIILLFMG